MQILIIYGKNIDFHFINYRNQLIINLFIINLFTFAILINYL